MNNTTKMILTLSVIGIISGGILSEVNDWAAPKIELNRIADTKSAIFQVISDAAEYEKISGANSDYFKVYDKNKRLLGFAIPFEGNGFQGKIRMMVGVSEDAKTIKGLKILEQLETPGLGNKISEEFFTSQFSGLNSFPQINYVKGKPASATNEIQAITGATISSKSVVNILNEGLKDFRDKISAEVENE